MMKRLAIRGAVVLTLAVGLTAVAALAGMWPLGGEQRAEASPGVDLVITMDPSPSEATVIEVNDTIDYYITVSNIGDTDAHNVLIRDWVGEGLNLIGLGGDPSVTCEHPPPWDRTTTAWRTSRPGTA